jgi:hypothetical protein
VDRKKTRRAKMKDRRCRETAAGVRPPLAYPYKTSQMVACLDYVPEMIPGARAWMIINFRAKGWEALPSCYCPDDKALQERLFRERHAKLNEIMRAGGEVIGLMIMEPVRASPEEKVTRDTPFKFYGRAMWPHMAADPEVQRFLDKCCEQFALVVSRGELAKHCVGKDAPPMTAGDRA